MDDKNRIPLTGSRRRRMHVKVAEAPGEGRLHGLAHGRGLILEKKHAVPKPGFVDFGEGCVVDTLSQIHPTDLGPEHR
jgi:hypothetical protein